VVPRSYFEQSTLSSIMDASDVLQVENLTAVLPYKSGPIKCLDSISFSLKTGQTLGIIGESDSGKSSLLLSILGLFEQMMQFRLASAQKVRLVACRIPPPTEIPSPSDWDGSVAGTILFNGRPIEVAASSDIQFIPSDDRQSHKIEVLRTERDMGESLRSEIQGQGLLNLRTRLIQILDLTHIQERAEKGFLEASTLTPAVFRKLQLVAALMQKPKLLVFDDPMSTLDVSEQSQVIEALNLAKSMFGLTIILSSQDVGKIMGLVDRIAILYMGNLLELGDAEEVVFESKHPYTKALMSSNPAVAMMHMKRGKRMMLRGIPGITPDPRNIPHGCVFEPRCEFADERCTEEKPTLSEIKSNHWAGCHHA